jgi:hypothetical protein
MLGKRASAPSLSPETRRRVDLIDLAQKDWRDLLGAAEFANDPPEHQRWIPRSGGSA